MVTFAETQHAANLVLVSVIPTISVVLVPVIQFFSCALLDAQVCGSQVIGTQCLYMIPQSNFCDTFEW